MANVDRSTEFNTHIMLVADGIVRGRIVPFLGAGVNLCSRSWVQPWSADEPGYFPNAHELAQYLAKQFHYPLRRCPVNDCPTPFSDLDLARVSQYGATLLDEGPLYDHLRTIFAAQTPPTDVHQFLATLRPTRAERQEDNYLLIVTTNYDDLMEQALEADGFDLVFYDADDKPRPTFWHKAPHEHPKPIRDPSSYPYEFFRDRPCILKVHGTIDRANPGHESFVITEDQYIEYLSEEPMEKLLPPRLITKMREKHHLLFLGYSLRDWNFRVFLRRLNRNPKQRYRSWAVLLGADEVERRFWEKNSVDIIDTDLKTYVAALKRELESRQNE